MPIQQDRWAHRIEYVSPGTLLANPNNPRTHSRAQRRKIERSIERIGFINPVIIDEQGKIVAGHGRVEAALKLGLPTVPAIRLQGMTEADKRAYALGDNRIADEAGWDRALLALELGELAALLPDLSDTGFDSGEIDIILSDHQLDGVEPADVAPARRAIAVTWLGEQWRLGEHVIRCGDARSLVDFERLMSDERARMVMADPPYNVPVRGHVSGRGRAKHREFAFASGEMSPSDFTHFLKTCLSHAERVSRPGALHYACIDWRHVAELVAAGREVYDEMLNLCVWNKTNGGLGALYRSQHELIGVFRVAGGPHRNNVELGKHGRNRSNVWTYAGVNSFGAGRDEALAMHPTVKPVALVADAMRDCTSKGDIVLDPFLGSGTTLMAAEKIGRRARGLEFEPSYVDVAIRRWQEFTRRDAILEGDGRTFAEIEAERGSTATMTIGRPETLNSDEGLLHEP